MRRDGSSSPFLSKAGEAAFFFNLMYANQHDEIVFSYFVSAFLSALKGCTEHNRLFSTDERFPVWHRRVRTMFWSDPALQQLFRLRNVEVHQIGTRTQVSGEEDVFTHSPRIIAAGALAPYHLDFSSPFNENRPDLRAGQGWVWLTEGEPDVIALSSAGLQIIYTVVKEYEAMKFRPDGRKGGVG